MPQIVPLDASDPEALAAWHATYLAADTHGREHPMPWMLEEMRANFLGEQVGERFLPFSALVDGTVVAAGLIFLFLKDNKNLADCGVWTHPDHRNAGHGSAMLEHLTQVVRDEGRTTISIATPVPYDGPPDGEGHPHTDFLVHHGYRFDIVEIVRVLDLPVDEEHVRRLADEAAPHHTGYTLRQFVGPVPGDILVPFGELIGSLAVEAPMGELKYEPEVFDEERIRADEKVFEASGRTKYTTVAVAPDGDVVAYSELIVPKYAPEHVYQWGTLVAPAHRGHRLGMATKAANLLWVQREAPDRSAVITTNAEVNDHMIAVNEALGFRPVERLAQYLKVLE
jgi:GNAT superfamily N-acetyltransferase